MFCLLFLTNFRTIKSKAMKKTISLMIIFLGLSLITSAKNFTVNDLHALPGMPLLHDDETPPSYTAQRTGFDSAYAMIFAQLNADSIESYIKQLQRQGHRYMYSPGQKNISVWVSRNLSITYSSANHDSVRLSYSKPEGGVRISMTLKNNCAITESRMLSAHSIPKIIFHPGRKAQAAPHSSCMVRDNIHAAKLCMAGMTHTLAFCLATTDVFHSFVGNPNEMLSVFSLRSEKTDVALWVMNRKMLG